MNIADMLELAADMDPSRAIVTEGARTLTLSELRSRARHTAGLLDARAAGPVGFVGVNTTAFPIALFSAAYAGRTFSPLNFRADARLLSYLVATLAPGVVVVDARYRERIDALATVADVIDTMTVQACQDTVGSQPPGSSAESVAVLIFTSGTSGTPKPVSLRHANLFSYVVNTIIPMSEGSDSATLSAAPNYHIASVANLLTSIYAGRRIVFLPEFSASEWLRLARRERVTHAFVVPTMLYRIVAELEAGQEPPSTLRTISYGGAPMPRPTIERALAAFPPSVGFVNAYGLTETSSTVALLGPEDHRAAHAAAASANVRARLGSVGKSIPGIELSVSDDDEILIRGMQVAQASGDSARKLDADGWLHTGDLGRVDEDGYLYVLGRIDDLIIRGGENISPVEIEDALRAIPGVCDAAAVGMPDPEWGQCVHAAIESDEPLVLDVLHASLVHSLPSFKRPACIVTVEALPRNDMGKVVRSKVVELLEKRRSDVKA